MASKLCYLTITVSEYIHELIQKCEFCTSQHYTAKAQAQYLKELKKNIPVGKEAVVLLDFAENLPGYSTGFSLGYITGNFTSCSCVL